MQKEIRIITQEAKETKTGAHSIPGRKAHRTYRLHEMKECHQLQDCHQGRNTEQMVSIDHYHHYQRGLGSVTEISLDSNCKLVLSVFVISLLSYGLCSQKQQ